MLCDELKEVMNVMQVSGERKPSGYYKKTEVDAAIAELKQKLEDAKATAYAESVDAGMRERRLKRALYKACANWAKVTKIWDGSRPADDFDKWFKVELKCLKKSEEYK